MTLTLTRKKYKPSYFNFVWDNLFLLYLDHFRKKWSFSLTSFPPHTHTMEKATIMYISGGFLCNWYKRKWSWIWCHWHIHRRGCKWEGSMQQQQSQISRRTSGSHEGLNGSLHYMSIKTTKIFPERKVKWEEVGAYLQQNRQPYLPDSLTPQTSFKLRIQLNWISPR